MYPGYPELYMQLNKKNEFHYQPDWYRGIEYPKEQERGYDQMCIRDRPSNLPGKGR